MTKKKEPYVYYLQNDTHWWNVLSKEEYEKYKIDGSVSTGDVFVFPQRVEQATEEVILKEVFKK